MKRLMAADIAALIEKFLFWKIRAEAHNIAPTG